jgi:GT2 family glycosyltransferase/glycosyltransferase involved in cell wall biosynthesis
MTQEKIQYLISVIRQKNGDLLQQEKAIAELRNLIRGLYVSWSWKFTKPLRRFHAILNNSHLQDSFPDTILPQFRDDTDQIITNLQRNFPDKQEKAEQIKVIQRVEISGEPVVEPIPEVFERSTMLDILVFPIIDWEFRFQRPQQLASQLARNGHRIFYFRTTFNRFSEPLMPDNLTVANIGENIYQVKLATQSPLNIYRDMVHGMPVMTDLLNGIEMLKKQYAIRNSVSIIDHPFWWPVARMLRNNINVYDCMDDHSGFDNNRNITTYEPALTAGADLVVVSSEILLAKVSEISKNVVQVKNGTDFFHFHDLPESDVLKEIRRPIIGYYGAIAEWFDVDLLEACARKFRDYQFVLIGRVTNTEIPRLKDLPNVHLTGEIPYAELPKYVRFFDVCLIPFRLTKLIEATNPVKFYEYISSGKPVVSVKLPELIPYRDCCYLSETHEDFIRNIQKALTEENQKDARIALAKENSWMQRGEVFYKGISWLYPQVSIVMVTCNNFRFTRACYESILNYTRYPRYELIIVDNNSTDETVPYLQELSAKNPSLKLILNNNNAGFAKANNQGMAIATGEFLVFLNNDTIVTNNWLETLVRHFTRDISVGLICPVTNETGNEACIRIDYTDTRQIQEFAFKQTAGMSTLNRDIRTVPLYCAMIRTEVLKNIGGLNEDYKKGMFEDDELSERVKQAGLRVCYAEDVFVHHFGRVSFKQLPTEEYQKLFADNKKLFEKRWGKWVPHIRGWFNTPVELNQP